MGGDNFMFEYVSELLLKYILKAVVILPVEV